MASLIQAYHYSENTLEAAFHPKEQLPRVDDVIYVQDAAFNVFSFKVSRPVELRQEDKYFDDQGELLVRRKLISIPVIRLTDELINIVCGEELTIHYVSEKHQHNRSKKGIVING